MGQYSSEEIDLRELVYVVLKKRFFILGLFLVFVAGAFVSGLLSPDIYEVDMLLEPRVLSLEGERRTYIDRPANMKAKIEQGAFLSSKPTGGIRREGTYKFNVSQPGGSDIIKVSLRVPEEETGAAENFLKELYHLAEESYALQIAHYEERAQKKVDTLEAQLERISGDIILLGEKKNRLAEEKEELISSERDILGGLREQTANLLWSKMQQSGISAEVLDIEMRRDIALADRIHSDILYLRGRVKDIESEASFLQREKEWLKNEVRIEKLEKERMKAIDLLKRPSRGETPVGPKKAQNVAVAGVLGLFVGILFAFISEYWTR